MTNELLNEWKKEKIVEDGDIVLAGVSGGADSVCLLLMLEQLQKKQIFIGSSPCGTWHPWGGEPERCSVCEKPVSGSWDQMSYIFSGSSSICGETWSWAGGSSAHFKI